MCCGKNSMILMLKQSIMLFSGPSVKPTYIIEVRRRSTRPVSFHSDTTSQILWKKEKKEKKPFFFLMNEIPSGKWSRWGRANMKDRQTHSKSKSTLRVLMELTYVFFYFLFIFYSFFFFFFKRD